MAKTKKYDVVGIGSALLDITVQVDDSFLKKSGLKKGEMRLVDEAEFSRLLKEVEALKPKKSSGGSCSNVMVGVSCLGGKSLFIGTIGKDSNGATYKKLLEKSGVSSALGIHGDITGCAVTFITPDSERSFAVYLGAAVNISKNDIKESMITNAKILHIEGFSFDLPEVREAVVKAMQIAKDSGMKVSLDLSDAGVIRRNKTILRRVIKNYVDIVFANEKEAEEFTKFLPRKALDKIYKDCEVAVVKLGEKGSMIKCNGKVHRFRIFKVKTVNTNGAGDAYAAGVLYSLAKDLPMEKAGVIAAFISSRVAASPEATVKHNLGHKIKEIIRQS
jgi:sugar/nucleoside kinase (ribokinase family)